MVKRFLAKDFGSTKCLWASKSYEHIYVAGFIKCMHTHTHTVEYEDAQPWVGGANFMLTVFFEGIDCSFCPPDSYNTDTHADDNRCSINLYAYAIHDHQ